MPAPEGWERVIHQSEAENRTLKVVRMIDEYTARVMQVPDAELRPTIHHHFPDAHWQFIARVCGYPGASEETLKLVKKALDQRPKLFWDILSRAT